MKTDNPHIKGKRLIFNSIKIFNAFITVALLAISVPAWSQDSSPEKIGPAWVWHVEADYEDVIDALRFAIEDRGMVITYTSHSKDMLERTAASGGYDGSVYSEAQVLLFCKVGEAHDLTRANPHNLALCPFAIAAYSLKDDPEIVYLSIREPYEDEKMVQPITQLQQSIIQQTIEEAQDN